MPHPSSQLLVRFKEGDRCAIVAGLHMPNLNYLILLRGNGAVFRVRQLRLKGIPPVNRLPYRTKEGTCHDFYAQNIESGVAESRPRQRGWVRDPTIVLRILSFSNIGMIFVKCHRARPKAEEALSDRRIIHDWHTSH